MRALVIVASLAGIATADVPDVDGTGKIVLSLEGVPRARARALDKLVADKRVDARTRALVPTPQVIKRELARLPTAKTKTRTPLSPESCSLTTGLAGSLVIQCSQRACGNGCQVLRNEATIRVTSGRWTVEATSQKRLGDTGECGCCMSVFR